ncbi:hypothetical protein GCM10028827_33270 [Mucilaginibacter myungsuensis]
MDTVQILGHALGLDATDIRVKYLMAELPGEFVAYLFDVDVGHGVKYGVKVLNVKPMCNN